MMWLFCCSQNSKMSFSVLAGNVEIGAAAGNSTYRVKGFASRGVCDD
jgi:hypothetical protein